MPAVFDRSFDLPELLHIWYRRWNGPCDSSAFAGDASVARHTSRSQCHLYHVYPHPGEVCSLAANCGGLAPTR